MARALVEAANRGVCISLVVESAKVDTMTLEAISALGSELRDMAAIYVWPKEIRQKDPEGRAGAMHVKCAVADEDLAFVSSANLTEYALSLNMELGVLVCGGPLPRETLQHFHRLIAEGVLVMIAPPA